ncbi:MAG: DHH family phosphoesterase [Firmicutes bacterium]|nr:DHH family phosphoesterase [Candidatus Fermentithermobacillaceae bacterium]
MRTSEMKVEGPSFARAPFINVKGEIGEWEIAQIRDEGHHKELSRDLGISAELAWLLLRRSGGSVNGAKDLWTGRYDFPCVRDLPGIGKGIDRISSAIDANEGILIYSDFDADGVTSAVILKEALGLAGACHTSVYLPSRFEDGYGFHAHLMTEFSEAEIGLIITADCGIVASDTCTEAKRLGIDVIITDHHKLGDVLPDALSIINPWLPSWKGFELDDLSGAGVAYLLAWGLLERRHLLNEIEPDWAMDLLTISIAGDGQPVTGLNRAWVKRGLKSIERSDRQGILSLLLVSGLAKLKTDRGLDFVPRTPEQGLREYLSQILDEGTLNVLDLKPYLVAKDIDYERDIMFGLVPRINAAGRMGHPVHAFDLLCSNDVHTCLALALELEELNEERRKKESIVVQECLGEIETHGAFSQICGDDVDLPSDETNACGFMNAHRGYLRYSVSAYKPSWHEGIIGIAASRVRDAYRRPCALIGGDGPVFKGSVRGVEGFNVYESLSLCKDLLVSFGGHEGAAGFSIEGENISEFVESFERACESGFCGVSMEHSMELDCLLSAEKVVGDFLHSCLSLEPFGRGNPVPLFGVEDCKIEGARLLGKNMSHLELLVDAGDTLRFIWFGAGERAVDVCFPGKCDVAFTPAKNMYNGQETVSLQVRDVRPARSLFGSTYGGICKHISGCCPCVIYTWSKDAASSIYVALRRMGMDAKLHVRGQCRSLAHDAAYALKQGTGLVISTYPWDLLGEDDDLELDFVVAHLPVSQSSREKLECVGRLPRVHMINTDEYLEDSGRWLQCRFPGKEDMERLWSAFLRISEGGSIPVWKMNPLDLDNLEDLGELAYDQRLLLVRSCISIMMELGMLSYACVDKVPIAVIHRPKGKVSLSGSDIYSYGLKIRETGTDNLARV